MRSAVSPLTAYKTNGGREAFFIHFAKMETILKCSVCLEIFENPRVLPCQHTFCFQCLTGIAKSRRGVVVCPQCRKHYPVPWEGVESFPANFFIKNVLDLMNDGSLVSNENTCSSCASNDLASCRCLFCGEFLCKDCASKHKKQKQDEGDDSADEKHQIAELSFLRNASSSKPKSYSICSKHSDEILKYHCENCDRVICRDCSVFEHREHNVILLKDALKELKGAVSSILEEGRSRIPHIRKALENAGSLSQQLKHQHESTATRIKETKQKHLEELKKSLDTREEELWGELQEWFDKGNTKLQERQHELELELGLMMSSCDFAEHKLKTLEQEDNFSSKKEILDSLKGIELGEISREEAAKAEVFWQYSDNKMSATLKEETQKAMGCLVLHSSFESCTETPDYAEASPGGLDESSSSSQFAEAHADCLDESSSSSQFAEAHADGLDESSSSSQFAEAHTDGLDESTDSFQTAIFASPEDEPYTVSSLRGLYTQLISIYPGLTKIH